jgi:hypothetical protein
VSTRIAVFTEVLPPANDEIAHASFDLLRALAEQQHEIRIFSTYYARDDERGQIPPTQNRIEVLRPFKNWSLFEIPRLLPLMLDFKPELIHVIHPRAQMMNFGWAKLAGALPALARLNNRIPVVTSLYDRLKPAHETKLMALLRSSQLITVSHAGHQHELGLNPLLAARDIRVLPMSGFDFGAGPAGVATETPDHPGLDAFSAQYPNFIFVPGRLEAHQNVEGLIAHLRALALVGHGIVVGSSVSRLDIQERRQLEAALRAESWGQRVLFTGTLSLAAEDDLLKRAWLTSLVSLPTESMSWSRYARAASRRSSPLLLTQAQVKADALTWTHDHNALIAQHLGDIPGLLSRLDTDAGLNDRLRAGGLELASHDVGDSPANLMSRWYTELLG